MAQTQYLKDYSICPIEGELSMFLERRQEVNADNNPIYIGWNREPNAATTALTWFIVKLTYTATGVIRYQLPDDGVQFKYAWDSRASYFS